MGYVRGNVHIERHEYSGRFASPKTSSPELVFRPAQRCRHEGLSGALIRPARLVGVPQYLSPTAGRALVRDQSSLMTRWWRFRPLFTWELCRIADTATSGLGLVG